MHCFRWEELKGLASDRKSLLEDSMKKATDFHQGWKCEVGWLEEAELKTYAEWKPCGLVRTCQADTDSHQVGGCDAHAQGIVGGRGGS